MGWKAGKSINNITKNYSKYLKLEWKTIFFLGQLLFRRAHIEEPVLWKAVPHGDVPVKLRGGEWG